MHLLSPTIDVGTPATADDDTVLITFEADGGTAFITLTAAEAAQLSAEIADHQSG